MASVRDRALSIVELLARNVQGLPMSEVADRLDIPRTAVHRLLADLKDTGYVKQDPNTSQYLLTVKLASLGLSYLAATGITDAAQPLLDDLAEASSELVRLAVIEGNQLTWVAKAQGARTGLRYDPDAGLDVYLPATANGLAWLAAVSDERALELIAAQGMERTRDMGPGAPQTLRALMAQVEETRERGYAVVFDAYEAGTSAMATAIRQEGSGEPIATVSIAGPSVRMTPERMALLAPQLQACAQGLALASGSSPMFGRR
ncbi:IclR family transcriptional regulator [Xylophilus sp. GW821-FHT01B05]